MTSSRHKRFVCRLNQQQPNQTALPKKQETRCSAHTRCRSQPHLRVGYMGCKAVQSLHQAGFTDTNRQELDCATLQLYCVLVAS